MANCEDQGIHIVPPEDPTPGGCCYKAGKGIKIEGEVISATGGGGTEYEAGENIVITNDVISAPNVATKAALDAVEVKADDAQTEAENASAAAAAALAVAEAKQDPISAGENVQINNNVISATDTTYTAGQNVTISAENVISASFTKAELLNILGLEEVEYSMTECDGSTSNYILLARREEVFHDQWGVTIYGSPETEISADFLITDGNNVICRTSGATTTTDIDGNGSFSIDVNEPTAATELFITVSNISCSPGVTYQGTAELYFVEGEPPYVGNLSMTGSGCFSVESINTR